MRQLAASLQLAQAAVLGSKLQQLEIETSRQEQLCADLQALGCENFRPDVGPNAAEESHPSMLALLDERAAVAQELVRLESEVADLSRVHSVLLRRGQRYLSLICRILASHDLTYSSSLVESLALTPRK